jgi:HD-GYP domain-containing protein (c-di-GMP phosphodiesterase class II)
MALDQFKIRIDDLTTGMYVSRLDRPWIETPLPLQGYYIRNHNDITVLKQYCNYVYIDIHRGKGPEDAVFIQELSNNNNFTSITLHDSNNRLNLNVKKLRVNKGVYQNVSTPKQEVRTALKIKKLVDQAILHIEEALLSQQQIPIVEIKKVANRTVDAIIRSPDAYIWLTKIKNKQAYLYGHSVRTMIWALALGRHLGLSRHALANLATGIMLSNVGKIDIPTEILEKPKDTLTDDELTLYTSHVSHALELLEETPGLNNQILTTIANMHERYDGTGYPQSLKGDEIPYLAKIAGIASAYDEMTFPHHQEFGLSPSKCIMTLYRQIDVEFQRELVEEFIQAIGIYPSGTLVELSTHETAMVQEQNPERRLRPKVIVLLDEEKKPYKRYKLIDLMKTEQRHGMQLDIVYSLPIGSYGADPETIFKRTHSPFWSLSMH